VLPLCLVNEVEYNFFCQLFLIKCFSDKMISAVLDGSCPYTAT